MENAANLSSSLRGSQMLVRLALEDEAETLVAMARQAVEQTLPHHRFSPDKVREVFRSYLNTAHPTFFFVEHNRSVVGFLQAEIGLYDFTDGLFTVQKTLYVTPEKRGSRASALLLRHFVSWSRRLGAREIFGGVDNGFMVGQTAKLLRRFGFEDVGCNMRLVLDDGQEEHR